VGGGVGRGGGGCGQCLLLNVAGHRLGQTDPRPADPGPLRRSRPKECELCQRLCHVVQLRLYKNVPITSCWWGHGPRPATFRSLRQEVPVQLRRRMALPYVFKDRPGRALPRARLGAGVVRQESEAGPGAGAEAGTVGRRGAVGKQGQWGGCALSCERNAPEHSARLAALDLRRTPGCEREPSALPHSPTHSPTHPPTPLRPRHSQAVPTHQNLRTRTHACSHGPSHPHCVHVRKNGP
jgi:hypothetical protein